MTKIKNPTRLHSQRAISRPICLMLVIVGVGFAAVRADDVTELKGLAPRDHVLLKTYFGGSIFIKKQLKEEYDRSFRTSPAGSTSEMNSVIRRCR